MMDTGQVIESLQWLRARAVIADSLSTDPEIAEIVFSLQLAESTAAKCRLSESNPEHPLQLVVFGPTQSGKSTVVNLILQSKAAGVSPLAGFTVHSQGFHVGHLGGAWLDDFFPGYDHVPIQELSKDDPNCYSSEVVQSPLMPAPVTLWDTPDFDSLRAGEYRESVVRALGLADVALLVVSKDKYADQVVWEVLDLVRALGRPLLICVNKVAPGDRELVVESLLGQVAEHWAEAGSKPAVVVLPWQQGIDEESSDTLDVVALRKSVSGSLLRVDRTRNPQQLQTLIDYAWPKWRKPVLAEVVATDLWRQNVQSCCDSILEQYKRDFLEHPQQDETFQRSLVELLQLLEIPAVAGVLGKTRQLITWPARQLLGLAGVSTKGQVDPDDSFEKRLLLDLFQQCLINSSELALDRAADQSEASMWWRAVATQLRLQREPIAADFAKRVLDYQHGFEPEIQAAAKQLYAGLQEQPVVLNSLRAARFGADAAAVALTVKSGGLGLVDLALAPAMLSVTSLLTEGAMGKYIDGVMRELRLLQYQRVEKLLIDQGVSQLLGDLPAQLAEESGFYNLDRQQFDSLAAALGQPAQQW